MSSAMVGHRAVEELEVTEGELSGSGPMRGDALTALGPVEERRRTGVGTVPGTGKCSSDYFDGVVKSRAGPCHVEVVR